MYTIDTSFPIEIVQTEKKKTEEKKFSYRLEGGFEGYFSC